MHEEAKAAGRGGKAGVSTIENRHEYFAPSLLLLSLTLPRPVHLCGSSPYRQRESTPGRTCEYRLLPRHELQIRFRP